MGVETDKRSRLIARMTDHVVQHGLANSGLRALARSAQTSDRMLLYYFSDKNDILLAVFRHLADRIEAMLDQGPPIGPCGPDDLLTALWARSQADGLQPYLHLLIELAAASARHGEPYRGAAKQIADRFHGWIASRLAIDGDRDRQVSAYRIMAMLDGLAVLKAVGKDQP